MRLLDVAKVINGDTHFPMEGDSRPCGVDITLDEACTEGEVTGESVVTGSETPADTYTFRPFGIVAELARRVSCHREDDSDWLKKQTKDATEQAVGRALVVQPYLGAEVWVGAAGVTQAADVTAARTAWTNTHVGVPILHVAPENLPALVADDIVKVTDNGAATYTIWGDPVVVNAGYTGFPSFWTGAITIYLSSIQNTDELWRDLRGNRVTVRAHRVAAVDTPPCSIVRAGAMPV